MSIGRTTKPLSEATATEAGELLDPAVREGVVASWRGHDPAVTLSIYADAKADELRAAGAKLFS